MLFSIALLLSASSAFAKFDPSYIWTTMETEHFLIHYHQGGDEIAKKAAGIAEDVHARLAPRIKWTPKQKTNMVLVDSMDESNGMSSPVPYNQMILFISQPGGSEGLGLVHYDDWLRMLITHEYTHTLQLDMVSGLPRTLQHILGRIYFPNMFQPIWMLEGLAVYEETEQTTGGRGRSPGSDMVLRMAVLEDAFPTLGQMSVFPDPWPAGQVPYLFGESFTRFLADWYGREKLADVSVDYSGRRLPFLVTSTGKRVLHERYDVLADEWQKALRKKYGQQRNEIEARGMTRSTQLTHRGFVNIGPVVSPGGSTIAYAASEADEFPSLRFLRAGKDEDEHVVENVFPVSASGTSLSWSPEGRTLYYTKIEVERNTGYYSDLYSYEIEKDNEVRLTKDMRARDPGVSPDGRQLVFVMNRMGMTRLATIDISAKRNAPVEEKDVMFLSPWSENQYESPRFSPDGTTIAVSVWQPGKSRDIWLLDTSGKRIEEVTHDRAIDNAPAWSRDGKYLYFSSDRSGVFNIYVYERETKKIYQLTNVLGGAFTPSATRDNTSLVFTAYSSKGFDIHSMLIDPSSWKALDPPAAVADAAPKTPDTQVLSGPTPTTPYSPLSTVYPYFWIPWYGSSEASGGLYGAFTMGGDVIGLHQYTASALYGPEHSRKWYSFDYLYDGLYPTIHLHASDEDVTYADLLTGPTGTKTYVESKRTQGAAIILPFIKTRHQQQVTVGYEHSELDPLTNISMIPGLASVHPFSGTLASGRIAYLFNSSQRYAFSISPEQGRTVELDVRRFDKAIGSDLELTKYSADWNEFLPLPWKHQVLQARVFGGTSTGDVIPQRAYQLGGDSPGDIILSLDDQTVHLRGYRSNVLRGQKAALGSLEYRFPLSDLERGWNTKAVYVRNVHGAFFAEAGNAWDDGFREQDVRRSIGAELRFDLTVAYHLPITLRFVVARGVDRDGLSMAYFGLWVPLGL